MVTKSGELKTYYQRNWEEFQPYVSGDTWSTITHVAGLVLPIIGLLHKPAGQAISYASNALNLFSIGREVLTEKEIPLTNRFISSGEELLTTKEILWARGYAHVWSIVKSGAEVIGTVASLRIGLAVHATMNLGESLYSLGKNLYASPHLETFLTLDGSEKVIRVASNALYLLTLVNFSNPVNYGFICVSLLLQVGLSFKKACDAYKKITSWKDMKVLDATAHAAMMLIYMTKVPFAWKLSVILPRTFVLMRPANQCDKINLVEGPPQITKEMAESVVPAALRKIAEQNGKEIMFYISSATHPELTQSIVMHELAGHLQRFPALIYDSLVKSPDSRKWFENYQKTQEQLGYIPPKIHLRTFSIEDPQMPSLDTEQTIESPEEVASRVDDAIRKSLREDPDGNWPSGSIANYLYLPVFAMNGSAIKAYLENEVRKNPEIPENMAHNIAGGSLRVVTMESDDLGNLHVTRVIDPKSTSN